MEQTTQSLVNPYIVSALFAFVVSLVSYMWVRLQRQIDRQQNKIQEMEITLTRVDQQKNGDYGKLNQKIDQSVTQVSEVKADVKDLSKSISELKGFVQSLTHHNNG